jgi:GNAT superfamily N-acetyltransferase
MLTSADTIRAAHGDAWQVQGQIRQPDGGDAEELPGVRLMASGLPLPQWNNGDVDDPGAVDIDLVARWYAERSVPWGLRVPAGVDWTAGRWLFRKRLMGLSRTSFRPAPGVPGVVVRRAGPSDLDLVAAIDAVAFESEPRTQRPWIRPHLSAGAVEVALAQWHGRPVATAYTIRSNGRAGAAVGLGGVAVLPDARGRGIAGAVSTWLLDRGFSAGAGLAHLDPDDDRSARVYQRLGFVEVDGLDIYVEVAGQSGN